MTQHRVLAVGVKRTLTSSLNGIATIRIFERTRSSNSDSGRRLHTGPDETMEGIPRPVRDVLVVGGGVAGEFWYFNVRYCMVASGALFDP